MFSHAAMITQRYEQFWYKTILKSSYSISGHEKRYKVVKFVLACDKGSTLDLEIRAGINPCRMENNAICISYGTCDEEMPVMYTLWEIVMSPEDRSHCTIDYPLVLCYILCLDLKKLFIVKVFVIWSNLILLWSICHNFARMLKFSIYLAINIFWQFLFCHNVFNECVLLDVILYHWFYN